MDYYNKDQSLLDEEDLREARIKARVGLYIRGTISLNDFYEMEKKEGDDIKAKRQEAFDRILDEIRKEKDQEDPETSEDLPFSMTEDEFRDLPVWKQSELYSKYPEEIRELLDPVDKSPVTKEQFQKMPLQEQNNYYKAMPEKIEALIDGSLDSVDRMDFSSQSDPSVGYIFHNEEEA